MDAHQGTTYLPNAYPPGSADSTSAQGSFTVPASFPSDVPRRRTREPSEALESGTTSGKKEQKSTRERVTKVQLVERDTIQVAKHLEHQAAQIQYLMNQASDKGRIVLYRSD